MRLWSLAVAAATGCAVLFAVGCGESPTSAVNDAVISGSWISDTTSIIEGDTADDLRLEVTGDSFIMTLFNDTGFFDYDTICSYSGTWTSSGNQVIFDYQGGDKDTFVYSNNGFIEDLDCTDPRMSFWK